MREQAPLAAAPQDVEDRVEDLPRELWILGRPCPLGAGMWGSMYFHSSSNRSIG